MPTPEEELEAVLRDARALVAGSGEDFELREIDDQLEQLRHGPVRTASIAGLFLPTGPLQEVSLAHGWGDRFLELADRFDAIEMMATDNGPERMLED